jgi:hypothetical protein
MSGLLRSDVHASNRHTRWPVVLATHFEIQRLSSMSRLRLRTSRSSDLLRNTSDLAGSTDHCVPRWAKRALATRSRTWWACSRGSIGVKMHVVFSIN